MDVRAKNVIGVFGVTAATGSAACQLLQLSQARATRVASRLPTTASVSFFEGAGSESRRANRRGQIKPWEQQRRQRSARATVAHRTAASSLARLLPLFVTLLHAMLRIDWLKYVGTPSMASGVFALVPAAWLVIRESFLVTKPVEADVAASGRQDGRLSRPISSHTKRSSAMHGAYASLTARPARAHPADY
jgi:hypothetical protein